MNPEQTSSPASSGAPEGFFAGSRLESWAFGILVALVFLVPLIFIPVPYLQQSAVKGYLITFGIFAVAILYVISRLKAKSFERITHPLSYIGVILALFLIASSVTSGDFMKSFFGQGFEYSSAAFVILLSISAWLAALFSSRGTSRTLSLYTAVFGSFVLLALFQIIKLADSSLLSFGGIFAGATSTPIGSWYDLGIYGGVIFILTSVAFLYFPMSRGAKYVIGVFWAVSFFFLVLVGLPLIWFGIALVFLALVFQRCFNEKKELPQRSRLPVFAFILFIIAAFFAWKGSIVSTPLVNWTKTGYSELHLPWQMTLDVGTGIIKASPILGSGPNTFSKEYLLYKPAGINQTQFWSSEFASGSGMIPTMALSLGLSGIVLFCLLYIYFIRTGVQAFRKEGQMSASETGERNQLLPYVAYSSFFAGVFLLYMNLVYVPSYANFFLTSIFIGIFLGSRISFGDVKLTVISFEGKGIRSTYARGAGMLVLLVLIAGFILYGMKAAALGYFTAGAAPLSASHISPADLATAKNDFHKALVLDHLDIYDQALAETDLETLNSLAQQISSAGSSAKPTEAQLQQIGALFNDAESYASAAVKNDPSNYYNYLSEARVYSAAVSLQVTSAYSSAITAYENAAKYDPYDPSIYLAMAELAANQGKYDDATSYLGSALQLKNNYTDAVYLLSEVQVAEGKTDDAITSVKFGIQLNPNDPTAYYELGLLEYNAGEYSDAVTSLATAVSLDSNYANAQYFLGLSDAKVGDTADAIAEFQQLAKTNPDNTDVASILANLEAGKTPFANEAPPISTPEKRSSPPFSDQLTK